MPRTSPLTRSTLSYRPWLLQSLRNEGQLSGRSKLLSGGPVALGDGQTTTRRVGSGVFRLMSPPLLGRVYSVAGVTKDSAGSPLGSCTVDLFYLAEGVPPQFMGRTVSDGSGNYSFPVPSPAYYYRAIAYKLGAPDVAGTTTTKVLGA